MQSSGKYFIEAQKAYTQLVLNASRGENLIEGDLGMRRRGDATPGAPAVLLDTGKLLPYD